MTVPEVYTLYNEQGRDGIRDLIEFRTLYPEAPQCEIFALKVQAKLFNRLSRIDQELRQAASYKQFAKNERDFDQLLQEYDNFVMLFPLAPQIKLLRKQAKDLSKALEQLRLAEFDRMLDKQESRKRKKDRATQIVSSFGRLFSDLGARDQREVWPPLMIETKADRYAWVFFEVYSEFGDASIIIILDQHKKDREAIRQAVAELNKKQDDVIATIRQEMAETRQTLLNGFRDLQAKFDDLKGVISEGFTALASKMDVLHNDLQDVRTQLEIVAENQKKQIEMQQRTNDLLRKLDDDVLTFHNNMYVLISKLSNRPAPYNPGPAEFAGQFIKDLAQVGITVPVESGAQVVNEWLNLGRAANQIAGQAGREATKIVEDNVRQVNEECKKAVDAVGIDASPIFGMLGLDRPVIAYDYTTRGIFTVNCLTGSTYYCHEFAPALRYSGRFTIKDDDLAQPKDGNTSADNSEDAAKENGGGRKGPEGDPLEAASPGLLSITKESHYQEARDAYLKEHPDDIVYFASERFVDWASLETIADYVFKMYITDGSMTEPTLKECHQYVMLEYEDILSWLKLLGTEEAELVAIEILSSLMDQKQSAYLDGGKEWKSAGCTLNSLLVEYTYDVKPTLLTDFPLDLIPKPPGFTESAPERDLPARKHHAAFAIRMTLPGGRDARLKNRVENFAAQRLTLLEDKLESLKEKSTGRLHDLLVRGNFQQSIKELKEGRITETFFEKIGLKKEDISWNGGLPIIDLKQTAAARTIEEKLRWVVFGNEKEVRFDKFEFDIVHCTLEGRVRFRHRHTWPSLREVDSELRKVFSARLP
ncbi:MAG: hypothetical protein U0790_16615 [Isosphaeraceae bacterium]